MKIKTPVREPSDIQSVLGYHDISSYQKIMVLDTINPYSFYKPVRSTIIGKLPDAIRRGGDVNNGFDSSKMFSLNISDIFVFSRIYRTWDKFYVRPNGKWYRAWDFVGYNHNAPVPYSYNVNDIVTYQPEASVLASPVFQLRVNANAELPITKFDVLTNGTYGSSLGEWRYGVVHKKSIDDDYSSSVSLGNPLTDKSLIQDIPVALNGSGEYTYCFIVTKINGEDSAQPTVWLDGGYGKMSITNYRVPILTTIEELLELSAIKSSEGIILSPISTVPVTLTPQIPEDADVERPTTTSANIEIFVEAKDVNGYVLDTYIYEDYNTFSYNAGVEDFEQHVVMDINNGNSINIGAFDGKLDYIESITARLSIYPNATKYNNGTFVFDKEYVFNISF